MSGHLAVLYAAQAIHHQLLYGQPLPVGLLLLTLLLLLLLLLLYGMLMFLLLLLLLLQRQV